MGFPPLAIPPNVVEEGVVHKSDLVSTSLAPMGGVTVGGVTVADRDAQFVPWSILTLVRVTVEELVQRCGVSMEDDCSLTEQTCLCGVTE